MTKNDEKERTDRALFFLFLCKSVLYKVMNILYNIFQRQRFQFAHSYNNDGKEPCDL